MTVQTKITSYEIGRRLEKKDPRLGLQPSAPCDKYARWDYINIFQINTDGIQGKKEELKKALIDNDVRIALIQETQLPKTAWLHAHDIVDPVTQSLEHIPTP